MNLSQTLHNQRAAMIAAAPRHRAHNLRAFGSVARGTAQSASDIDPLVDTLPGATCLTSVRCKWSLRNYVALSYVGLSVADFLADRKTQQTAILNLIGIGETAPKIDQDRARLAGVYCHEFTYPVNKHARNAQSNRPRLLRNLSRYRLGHIAHGVDGFADAIARDHRQMVTVRSFTDAIQMLVW